MKGDALVKSYEATVVTQAKRIVTMQSSSTAFSLVLTDALMLCQQLAYQTEHPKLYIVEIRHNLRYFKNTQLHTLDINMNTYSSSQFLHLEQHFGQQLTELNTHVMRQLCLTELQTMANLQTLATVDPAAFAYAWKKTPGYSSVLRGEVLHLIKCVPVSVYVRATSNCYFELPVSYLNESIYMNPRSRILTFHGGKVGMLGYVPN